MPVTYLTQAQWIQNWVNAYTASLDIDSNLQVGDPALAIAEADGSQATVLQYLAILIINFARASTSTGSDLDSWMNDFAFYRLPAGFGTGQATFSIPIITSQPVYVPNGTIIQTPGGAIQYKVIGDNSLPNYNSAMQSYYVPIGFTSTIVAVQAITAGADQNVQANQLIQLVSNVFGISAVTNASAIKDGTTAETDPQFRARFVAYINGLSKATETAIFFALDSLQPGLKIALYQNVQAIGNPPTSFVQNNGMIVALIDDGTGTPSATLLAAALAQVAATVAFGIQYAVYAPYILAPTFGANIRVLPGFVSATVILAVQAAVVAWVNAQPIGTTIFLSDFIDIVGNVPGVQAIQVNSWTINTMVADLTVQLWQEALIDSTHVSIGTF